ncbi:CCR4-NOT transcription complex subunit [Pleurostoma richardsiae]|uniref:CCR4-NOT transcription complex subunit n=1 Tax=Pleurostoma richardsiae TaxID=41990 RepID=A0AA38RP73_9PEZI|nr:CCR4-NOT transcription complex subunit [Pleurostoma richardsiae]
MAAMEILEALACFMQDSERAKLSHDINQAAKVAKTVETMSPGIIRDVDLPSVLDHFKLDAVEKMILALAFRLGSCPDLRTKADAILAATLPTFTEAISDPKVHADLDAEFLALILDRLVQLHPPSFGAISQAELSAMIERRYAWMGQPPPSEVLAALSLRHVLAERSSNTLARYIHKVGPEFTRDGETCASHLQSRPDSAQLSEEQVSVALLYTTVSRCPPHDPAVLVAGLRRVLPSSFRWQDVVSYFDRPDARISPPQFLSLYDALRSVAEEDDGLAFDIQSLWGGDWENTETQVSFVCAFISLTPEQLDARTIPGLRATLTLEAYGRSPAAVRERAAIAVKHPLVSLAAMSAIVHVVLHSAHASQTIEAERLFQVLGPNMDIFAVSAVSVPRPWTQIALDSLSSIFESFLRKQRAHYDFVLESMWRKDRGWVKQQLIDVHADEPMILPLILEHALKHSWLDELVYLNNGLGLDLTALAHAEGHLNLGRWALIDAPRHDELAQALARFLEIKAGFELHQDSPVQTSLRTRTVYLLLMILKELVPNVLAAKPAEVRQVCVRAYPRLLNYGEGCEDVIDANSRNGSVLPGAAVAKMTEHYEKMHSGELKIADVIEVLKRYKQSRDPLDQDVFVCMIQELLCQYTSCVDYSLSNLATTAVLFGGIMRHKLLPDLAHQASLDMILKALRDHPEGDCRYKLAVETLLNMMDYFPERLVFCAQILQIRSLEGTDVWKTAKDALLNPGHSRPSFR